MPPKQPKKQTPTDTKQSSQLLPDQEKFFQVGKLKRSARAGTNLPDPSMVPYGYKPDSQYRHLFPELKLPALFPPAEHHPDDNATFGHPELSPHQLYFGDNLYVMRSLPSESIDLIYIDPPFFSNRDYVQIWGDDNEIRSFQDIFGDGMYSYLAWLNARLWEMKRLLKPTGSIYVHCDWHASHYIKGEMDKIFGYGNFLNEIIWRYRRWTAASNNYQRMHDTLLYYAKSKEYIFNRQFEAFSEKTTIAPFQRKIVDGRAVQDKTKLMQRDPEKGVSMHDVWDIAYIHPVAHERLGYPTQKPEALLERVIAGSSNTGDVVADFFMGGGTTGAVAMKKGRRFIGSDISRVAVSVSYNRLVEAAERLSGIDVTEKQAPRLELKTQSMADIRVGYVGSYPIDKFEGMPQAEFRKFILGLYDANPYTGQHQAIHGTASSKVIIHVGPSSPKVRVDSAEATEILEAALKQYSTDLAGDQEKIIQIIAWGFDPAVRLWRNNAVAILNKKKVPLSIELVSLSSEAFRQKIFQEVGESNIDLKLNKLDQLLNFTQKPNPGSIVVKKHSKTKVELALSGASVVAAGGRLINAQWDFDYRNERFSDKKYALMRQKVKQGAYEALLDVGHDFEKYGEFQIAARIQDNLDGEATVQAKLQLSESKCKIEIVNAD